MLPIQLSDNLIYLVDNLFHFLTFSVIRKTKFTIHFLPYILEITNRMTFNNHHNPQVLATLSHCKTIVYCIHDLLRSTN